MAHWNVIRKLVHAVAIAAAGLSATTAVAGPPFITDDPEPTDTGHWEIYAPLFEMEGRGNDIEGSWGAEVNYGAARNVQLSAFLPMEYSHDAAGWRSGRGDIELSAKYRFLNDEARGLQVAAFPAITLPTGGQGLGNGRVALFLPVWLQKDAGHWSVFGGGGFNIHPGVGNRNYWSGGLTLTREFDSRLLLGVEADRKGSDTFEGRASTSLGFGAVYKISAPLRMLASGGPSFEDGDDVAGFHAFLALGLDL